MKSLHSILFVTLFGLATLLTAGGGGEWNLKRVAAAVRNIYTNR